MTTALFFRFRRPGLFVCLFLHDHGALFSFFRHLGLFVCLFLHGHHGSRQSLCLVFLSPRGWTAPFFTYFSPVLVCLFVSPRVDHGQLSVQSSLFFYSLFAVFCLIFCLFLHGSIARAQLSVKSSLYFYFGAVCCFFLSFFPSFSTVRSTTHSSR